MGRPHVDTGSRLRVEPAVEHAPAREDETMLAVPVYHGEFELAVKGRCRDGLPHARMTGRSLIRLP